jgi:hypothetical protein
MTIKKPLLIKQPEDICRYAYFADYSTFEFEFTVADIFCTFEDEFSLKNAQKLPKFFS